MQPKSSQRHTSGFAYFRRQNQRRQNQKVLREGMCKGQLGRFGARLRFDAETHGNPETKQLAEIWNSDRRSLGNSRKRKASSLKDNYPVFVPLFRKKGKKG